MIALVFAVEAWLSCGLALLGVLLVGRWRQARRAAYVRQTLPARRDDLPAPRLPLARLWWFAFAAAAAAALLQPVAGFEEGEPAGPDVVFCLDVSWSMAAQDVRPSRLDHAAQAIEALARRTRGARFGLVTFAGESRLDVPLTTDVAAVTVMAAQLVPGAELRGGTDLGAAIDRAAEALERAGASAGSIVLLTDGEDFSGAGRKAAARAHDRGLVVHCLGVGTLVGSKIAVDGDGGQRFLQDASGQDVISALDPETLALAAAAGGGEHALAAGANVLGALYDDQLLPRAERAARTRGDRQLAHRFQWPLSLALLAWMLHRLLPERRR